MPEDRSEFREFVILFSIGFFILYFPWFFAVLAYLIPHFLENYQIFLSKNQLLLIIELYFIFYFFANCLGIFIGFMKKKKQKISRRLLWGNFFSIISCIIIICFLLSENNLNLAFFYGFYCFFLICVIIGQINYLKKNHFAYNIPFPKGSIFKGSLSTKIIRFLNKRNKDKLIFTGDFILEEEHRNKKPEYYKDEFICPFCELYVSHKWYADILENVREKNDEIFTISRCTKCNEMILWSEKTREIVYPNILSISKPNMDMEEEIRNLYSEASKIYKESPRGAAAILRVSLEKLLEQAKIPGNDLNNKIKNLLKEGVDENIRKACHIVRIYGNYAVHAGEIDLNDNLEITQGLFWLINKIANIKITEKKKIDSMFSSLPKSKRDQISRRDSYSKKIK